jgi:hypothetical protein
MKHNLKPVINLNKPIIFRAFPGASLDMMTKVLKMFSSLEDFSEYLHYGNYQIMSRIRMGYVFSKRNSASVEVATDRGGGTTKFNQRGGLGGDDVTSNVTCYDESLYETLGIHPKNKRLDENEFEKAYEKSFSAYAEYIKFASVATASSGGSTNKRNQSQRKKRRYKSKTKRR